jgi:hypothetical protein
MISNERMMMKRKALRGVNVQLSEPENRRLNFNAESTYAEAVESGVAEGEGASWAFSRLADTVEETSFDQLSMNGAGQELTQNVVGNHTNVTKAVTDGKGGGGGGGTGYAYSTGGGSSQGIGSGSGEGSGGGLVQNSDGSMSDGGGDGYGQGSGVAYAYSLEGGTSSSSASGNGAGYGDGAATNSDGDGDYAIGAISGLSQNALAGDYDYGGYGGYGRDDVDDIDDDDNKKNNAYGIAVSSAFSSGDGQALGYATGSGGVGRQPGLSRQSRGLDTDGFGFSLDDEDDTTGGTLSGNSASAPGASTFGQGVGIAGTDGIGIGIGIGIGPSSTNSSDDRELSPDNFDSDGNIPNTQRLTITLDITS